MDGLAITSPVPERRPSDAVSALRFQERDGEILRAVYRYDGVLAKRHIKGMFWPDASTRAMEMRLSTLYHQAYLDWPNREQWRTKPIPEAICWLGWKGALWIAGDSKLEVEPPRTPNETQLRRLAAQLREHGIRWLREPRWSQLAHDLSVVDFRQAVEKAVNETPSLAFEEWIPEGVFLSNMDVVAYSVRDRKGSVKQQKRGVRPDGYFSIVDNRRHSQGLPARARFLLELDMATHDTNSFFQEKVIAGVAYMRSPAYKARFGHNSGRWLVVTTGEVRMKHLMRQTQQAVGESASVFFFTTFEQVKTANVLTVPIWWQKEHEQPIPLFVT